MARPHIQDEAWAVFAPSGAVSWRSFETSRDASLRAFAGEHWRDIWPSMEAGGYCCLPVRITPDLARMPTARMREASDA